MQFFDRQRVDKIGKVAVTLEKWLIFFAISNTIFAIFGLPMSLISLTLRLSVLAFGFFGALHRKTCCLLTYFIIKFLAIALDVAGGLIGLVMIGVFFGYLSFEATSGQITIEPEAFELSILVLAGVVFLLVIYMTLYFAFNIYTMYLALRIRKLIKKEQKRALACDLPQAKELVDYSAVPQNQTPVEFKFVAAEPIYLQPVVV